MPESAINSDELENPMTQFKKRRSPVDIESPTDRGKRCGEPDWTDDATQTGGSQSNPRQSETALGQRRRTPLHQAVFQQCDKELRHQRDHGQHDHRREYTGGVERPLGGRDQQSETLP